MIETPRIWIGMVSVGYELNSWTILLRTDELLQNTPTDGGSDGLWTSTLRVGSRPIFQDLLFLSTFPGICLSVFLFLSIFWLPKSPKNTTFPRFCLENTPKIFRLRRAFIFPHFLESEFFRIFYFYQLFPEFDSGFFIDGGVILNTPVIMLRFTSYLVCTTLRLCLEEILWCMKKSCFFRYENWIFGFSPKVLLRFCLVRYCTVQSKTLRDRFFNM